MRQKRLLLLLASILILQTGFYVYGLYERQPDIDDAWIGEPAYYMSKIGYAKSELMRGWKLHEERLLIHHKLMTLLGYSFIEMFGFSLYTLKSVSLLFFIAFLIFFYYFTVLKNKIFNLRQFLLAVIILLTFHYSFKFTFIFRPEVVIMFFAFVAFHLLNQLLSNKKYTFILAFSAGILSGLCFVAHLNGLAIIAAGGGLLAIHKRWKQLALFMVGSLCSMLIYFYDFSAKYGYDFWHFQLFESVLGKDSGDKMRVVLYMLNNLLKEHMRFFHDLTVIGFSLLFLFLFIAGFKAIMRNHRYMLQYFLIMVFVVALLFTQKSRQYILIYLPYMVIFMTITIDKYITGDATLPYWARRINSKIALIILILFFVATAQYYNYKVAKEKFSANDNHATVEKYIGANTSNLNIIAPMEFIFNEIDDFKRIQGERFYTTIQKHDSSITCEGFLRKANTFDIDYIILSDIYRKDLDVDTLLVGDSLEGYRVVKYSDKMSILKRVIKDR